MNDLSVRLHNANNRVYYLIDTSTAGTTVLSDASGIGVMVVDKWYHVIANWRGGEQSLWINQIKQAATQANGGTLDDPGAALATFIGADSPGGGSPFDGQIDHVLCWNRGLFDAEIIQLRRNPLPMFQDYRSIRDCCPDVMNFARVPKRGQRHGNR
jgi:hypothetical protein